MWKILCNGCRTLVQQEDFDAASRLIWAFFWALLPALLLDGLIGQNPTAFESLILWSTLFAAYIGFRTPVDRITWQSLRSNLCYSTAVFLTAWCARAIFQDVQFTTEVIALINGNTGMVILFAIIIFSVLSLYRFIFSFRPLPGVWAVAQSSRLSSDDEKLFGPWTRLQKNDAEVIATHEAGHAVVLGLFKYDLPDLSVAMRTLTNGDPISGFCLGPWKRGNLKARPYMELEMIKLLAGAEAEDMLLGERTCGAISDYRYWLELAEKFLATDLHSIFYTHPENDTQKAHNQHMLLNLKGEQAKKARLILEANIGILDELRERILAKGKLKGHELLEALSRVVSVEGCPVISERTKACYIPKPA